ncbi:hypothetical protein AB0M22_22990 [Nocardia sp. NPDC051756]|uniref:hypothetical protein n=1 Tax=Nocardia sp. NPDC051756 TaxID=3154751 RepID=UPI00343F8B9B
MTRHRASLGNIDSGRRSRTPSDRIDHHAIGTRNGVRASAGAAALCAIAAGPVAGGQLVLLGKPLGGLIGVPGAVVGYIVLTAAVLGLLVAALWLWRLRSAAGTASACGVLAGFAVIVAGAVDSVVVFTIAVLVAGAATGPLLAVGRALAFDLGRGGLVRVHAAAMVGMAAAAWLAGRYYADPGGGLIIAGALTSVLGLATGLLARRGVGALPPVRRAAIGVGVRSALPGYLAAGIAIGGATLPALHLLLFRWNEFGAAQCMWLSIAAAPAVVAIIVPRRRPDAVPVLLILAAGGMVLVATAPGPATLIIGLALTLSAGTRAVTTLDEGVCLSLVRAERTAAAGVTAAVAALSGVAALGVVDLLGRLIGAGSALTVSALCVLVVVWSAVRSGARQRMRTAVEGGVS